MMRRALPAIFAMLILTSPLHAQLSAPGTVVDIPPVGGVLRDVTTTVGETLEQTEAALQREAQAILRLRERRLAKLLRDNREVIERDGNGNLARRGVLMATSLDGAGAAALTGAGFVVLGRDEIEGLGISVTRLRAPETMGLAEAQAVATSLAPGAEISADNLHFQSGHLAETPTMLAAAAAPGSATAIEVGVIDGAPGMAVPVSGKKGFATGAPTASDHGSAVTSLLKRAGVAHIRVADVYGTDPAGGNALAIARALGWLTASGSKIVTISLVGPRNALLQKAIAAAQSRGVVIVAAVGNDGPAAPPAYPASYDGVVAVTGTDRRNRALIEAGRALHLDYAAPGDQVHALDAKGRLKPWRGTSFATPLVAARIAAALQSGTNWRPRTDAEAIDLGPRGPDKSFGRGLLCRGCGSKN